MKDTINLTGLIVMIISVAVLIGCYFILSTGFITPGAWTIALMLGAFTTSIIGAGSL